MNEWETPCTSFMFFTCADLYRESELNRQFNLEQLSQPSPFQALYAAVMS